MGKFQSIANQLPEIIDEVRKLEANQEACNRRLEEAKKLNAADKKKNEELKRELAAEKLRTKKYKVSVV